MHIIHVILRTSNHSILQEKIENTGIVRICGNDRTALILKCVTSLITTINNSTHKIRFTIIDDHSDKQFLKKLKRLLKTCKIDVNLIELTEKNFNRAIQQQCLLAANSEELVYMVEDDYLHEPTALDAMVVAYEVLSNIYKDNIAIFPFDCPFRYELTAIEPTVLLHDGTRYWRHVKHTTYTLLTHSSIIKKHFKIFDLLAAYYPTVNEENTINTLYKGMPPKPPEDIVVFNPIPSVAYHLAYQEPTTIKTEYLTWKSLWDFYK